MTVHDAATLESFLSEAAERLVGDWVVIGGAALPLMGVGIRPTADKDIAGPEDASLGQSLVLLEIAEEVGLPVEAINQAAGYFLRRIEGWRQHVVMARAGRRGAIFRPDATLFVLLKLRRLTETDLADIRLVLEHALLKGEPIDLNRLRAAVEIEKQAEPSPSRLRRLEELSGLLAASHAGDSRFGP